VSLAHRLLLKILQILENALCCTVAMIANAPESAIVSSLAAPAAPRRSKPAALPVLLRLVLIAPLFLLTHCAGKGYKAATYSAEKLATPAHNMSQRDYPFDADGNYRKDWVKNGSTRPGSANVGGRKSSSSSSAPAPAPARTTVASTTPAPARPSSPSSSGSVPRSISPPRTTVPAASTTTYRPAPAPAPKPTPKPKPKPTPPPARYHKVEAKQTLWSISQKYGVSVEALQRANGLSGNLIRIGQSLRIP
jgi:LysM repeat protein